MNSKFFDLKKEKQDRMINASLKFFALQATAMPARTTLSGKQPSARVCCSITSEVSWESIPLFTITASAI